VHFGGKHLCCIIITNQNGTIMINVCYALLIMWKDKTFPRTFVLGWEALWTHYDSGDQWYCLLQLHLGIVLGYRVLATKLPPKNLPLSFNDYSTFNRDMPHSRVIRQLNHLYVAKGTTYSLISCLYFAFRERNPIYLVHHYLFQYNCLFLVYLMTYCISKCFYYFM
jgi:hypothetical protein